ncbi:MAG: nucleotidyl transferase AbiEii/AbiGii toxin family protein [Pseudoxanthomonas sp.]
MSAWSNSTARAFCMFKRPHHQRIQRLLKAFDGDLLRRANCYFAGGTAIVLALEEYRESIDVDFLCADRDGYRLLRSALALPTLGSLVTVPLRYRRDVRTDRDKISTYVEVEDIAIKVEIVLEARIELIGEFDINLGVPVLSREDLYAEKLLATADRGLDRSVLSRDLIDLGMMIRAWGPIPPAAWEKATGAYGKAASDAFDKSRALLNSPAYLAECMRGMSMDPALAGDLRHALQLTENNLDHEVEGPRP